MLEGKWEFPDLKPIICFKALRVFLMFEHCFENIFVVTWIY